MPLFSIYILNHNYSKFLKHAIVSVVNQSFKDFEFFIIDDGSTDNSIELIKDLQKLYSIDLIEQKNIGMIKSLNIALNRAKGKYLFRLDADDYLRSDSLSHFSELLKVKDYSYIFSAYNLINEQGLYIKKEGLKENTLVSDHIPHGACMTISVDRLSSIGGYDEKYSCQDGTYIWKHFHNENIAYIDKPLFNYRKHNNNMSLQGELIKKEREKILIEI